MLEEQEKAIRVFIENPKSYTQKLNCETNEIIKACTQELNSLRVLQLNTETEKVLYKNLYLNMQASFFWKVTYLPRKMAYILKTLLKKTPLIKNIYEKLSIIYNDGLIGLKNYYGVQLRNNAVDNTVKKLFKQKNFSISEYGNQTLILKQIQSPIKGPKISVVCPVYNTPILFLNQLVESVQNQTYHNWELCFVDASDNMHSDVCDVISSCCKQDNRIVFKKLEENLGISDNTNEALKLATGDFIGLLDHDDLLHPSALYHIIEQALNGADVIYTDEIVFEDRPSNVKVYHFKSDFSIDNLRSNNYICHFTVFSKELFLKVGNLRKEFDGSQDYDFILRLTEKATKIAHIPHALYFWRKHDNSVTSDISVKPYCLRAGADALNSHYERCNIDAKANLIYSAVGCYKTNYALTKVFEVSVVIPFLGDVDILDRCLNSLANKTAYKNYEIILVSQQALNVQTIQQQNIKVV